MTKEEKAQRIVAQGGGCDAISCDPRNTNECPCYSTCGGGGSMGYPRNLKTCQDFLIPLTVKENFLFLWDEAPESATMLKLQREFFVPSSVDGRPSRTMVLRETLYRETAIGATEIAVLRSAYQKIDIAKLTRNQIEAILDIAKEIVG